MYFPHNTSYVSPHGTNAPVHTKQVQRLDQNLRQKQAVYNRKIFEYNHVIWNSTNISRCSGVLSLSYQRNHGIKFTKMKQDMEETRIPQVCLLYTSDAADE